MPYKLNDEEVTELVSLGIAPRLALRLARFIEELLIEKCAALTGSLMVEMIFLKEDIKNLQRSSYALEEFLDTPPVNPDTATANDSSLDPLIDSTVDPDCDADNSLF